MRQRAAQNPQPTDAQVLERISTGESLRSIARAHGLDESTIRKRFRDDPQLAPQYAHAREAQADHYAERIVDEALSSEDAAIGRLRMDALKWAASKLAPKRYGDKQQVEHSGSIGVRADEMRDDDLARIASAGCEEAVGVSPKPALIPAAG